MSRYARRVDGNHKAIADALRQLGVKVRSTAALGDGFPDLFCGWRGKLTVLEVKDPSQKPSARRLTDDERKFFEEWTGYPVFVVETLDEALKAIGVTK